MFHTFVTQTKKNMENLHRSNIKIISKQKMRELNPKVSISSLFGHLDLKLLNKNLII